MSDKEQLDLLVQRYADLRAEIAKVIVGQTDAVDSLLLTLFSGGHCLLLGVPGLAKTLMVSTLARTLGLTFNRIQFTPDLMPSDITGSEILDQNRQLQFLRGPLFAGIVLADEINRTPPKTQAALLEAMQEHSVTVSGTTYQLPAPFFVLATQNPIEQEGTYPLPEAQLDRFMFNVRLDYPSFDEEVQIVKQTTAHATPQVQQVLDAQQILDTQQAIRRMPVADNVVRHAVSLVAATRPGSAQNTQNPKLDTGKYISYGAGPRASQYLILGAKSHAAIHGKYSPDNDDVDAVALAILRHRIVLSYFAQAENITTDDIIKNIINAQN
ncbi:MAG: MoxR family ATPase [Bacteroidales bacterium]|nr:MoxR family ATPase [Bacteroidales bacterium]